MVGRLVILESILKALEDIMQTGFLASVSGILKTELVFVSSMFYLDRTRVLGLAPGRVWSRQSWSLGHYILGDALYYIT